MVRKVSERMRRMACVLLLIIVALVGASCSGASMASNHASSSAESLAGNTPSSLTQKENVSSLLKDKQNVLSAPQDSSLYETLEQTEDTALIQGTTNSSASDNTNSSAQVIAETPAKEVELSPAQGHATTGQKTVVVIGDSLASGHVFGYDEQEPWPTFLQSLLYGLEGEWVVENLGVSSTMLISTGAIPYRDTGNIDVAKSLSPDYVLFMLGTNDSYDVNWDANVYEADLFAVVNELQQACPGVQMVLMSPAQVFCNPDPASGGVFHMDDAIIGNEIRPIVAKVAEQTGAQFVDVYEFTKGHSEWFPDTIHPNGQGNRAIAQYIFEVVFA